MVSVPRHTTKAELALRVVRERISDGELKPGQRLHVDDLTRELGMSPTPIREALRLLQADGLVDYVPHHGVVVAGLVPDAVIDIYRLRLLLEPLAVELALPVLARDGIGKLEQEHRKLVAAVTSGGRLKPWEVNRTWHWIIYDAADSRYLTDFIRRLWDVLPWRTIWAIPGRPDVAVREHERVMAAIRQNDVSLAATRMREHLEASHMTLFERLETEQERSTEHGTSR